MTVISIEEFRTRLDHYLAATAREDVILTRDGKPCVLLRAIPENATNGAGTQVDSPEFWRMVQQRRQEKGIPWEDAKKQLTLDEQPATP